MTFMYLSIWPNSLLKANINISWNASSIFETYYKVSINFCGYSFLKNIIDHIVIQLVL